MSLYFIFLFHDLCLTPQFWAKGSLRFLRKSRFKKFFEKVMYERSQLTDFPYHLLAHHVLLIQTFNLESKISAGSQQICFQKIFGKISCQEDVWRILMYYKETCKEKTREIAPTSFSCCDTFLNKFYDWIPGQPEGIFSPKLGIFIIAQKYAK